jgi:hypothetical protein
MPLTDMNMTYAIEAGRLVIRDPNTDVMLWSGTFDGYPVLKIVPVQQGEDGCLVLLDWSGSRHPTLENLFLIRADGSVAWRVPLPDSNDTYVNVHSNHEGVVATTWSGLKVMVDLSDRTIKTIAFTK